MTSEDRINLGLIVHFVRLLPGVSEESVQVVTHYLGVCVDHAESADGAALEVSGAVTGGRHNVDS